MKKTITNTIAFITFDEFKDWYKQDIISEDQAEIENLIFRASSEVIAMSNKNNLIEDYNGDLIPSTDRYFIDTITKEITAKFYDMGVDKATTSTSSTFGSKAETYSFDNDNSLQERCYNLLAKTRYYSSEVFETSFVIEGIDQEGQVDPDSAKFATGEYLDQVSIEKSDTETDTTLLTKQAILDAVKKESSQLFFNDGSSVNTQETKAETLIERFAEVLTDGTLHLSARTNDGTQFTVAIDPNTGHFDLDGLIIKSGSLANIDIVDDNDNKIGSFEFIGQDGGKWKINDIALIDMVNTDLNAKKITIKEDATADDEVPKWSQVKNNVNKDELGQEGSQYFANKVAFGWDNNGKLSVQASYDSTLDKDEIKFTFDEGQDDGMIIERNRANGKWLVNMINTQILKTAPITNNAELVNMAEVISYVANALGTASWNEVVNNNTIKEEEITEDGVNIDSVYTDDDTNKADSIFYNLSGTDDEISYSPVYAIPKDTTAQQAVFRVKLDVSDDIYVDFPAINPKYRIIDITAPLIDGFKIEKENTSVIEYKKLPNGTIDVKKTIEFSDIEMFLRNSNDGWRLSLTNRYKEDNVDKFWSDRKLYIQNVKALTLSGGSVDLTDYYTKTETDTKLNDKVNVSASIVGASSYITNQGDAVLFGTRNNDKLGAYISVQYSPSKKISFIRARQEDETPVAVPYDDALTTKAYVDANFRKLAKEMGLPDDKILELFPLTKEIKEY